jgi:hypothetical protein
MGEKETMSGAEAARRSGTLNVSATPGGSVAAAMAGAGSPGGHSEPAEGKAIVRTILDAVGSAEGRAANPVYSDPTNAGEMPAI